MGANFVSMPRKPVPVASADLREQKETSKEDTRHRTAYELGANDRFVWNRYLVQDFLALESTEALRGAAKSWTVVLLHGSFSQRECDIFGKQINITLLHDARDTLPGRVILSGALRTTERYVRN